ncbi:unnamed protein product, partial [Fusarium equiseti]
GAGQLPVHAAQQGQQRGLGQQGQHHGQHAEGAYARVLHDLQRALALGAAAQAIGHVGPAILAESPGQQLRGRGAEHGGHQRRPGGIGQAQGQRAVHQRGPGPHQQAHAREMRGTGTQHPRAVADPARQPPRDRDAGEELQGQQVVAHEVHGALSDT